MWILKRHCLSYTQSKQKKSMQLRLQNCIPILLCVTESICSLAPDRIGRYTGFWYADGKMINQLDACKLEVDKEYHIHMELLDGNTNTFIEKSPNPSVWEISNSEKMNATRHLDICFNDVDTFIESMQYSYDNMISLCFVHTDKMTFKKSEGGGGIKSSVKNINDKFYS